MDNTHIQTVIIMKVTGPMAEEMDKENADIQLDNNMKANGLMIFGRDRAD